MLDNASQHRLLQLEDLAVAAGGRTLLENITASIDPGDALALTGPSGCGKTTLLRAICGLVDPSAGDIVYKGEAPAAYGWSRFRSEVVLVSQQAVLLDLSVRENLERPLTYRQNRRAFPEDDTRRLLDRLRLEPDCLDQQATSLSVGQQQRVCLVRALLLQPSVLLLDEPTSALDADAEAAVETLLAERLENGGLAILLATHADEQAERLGTSVLNLRDHLAGRRAAV